MQIRATKIFQRLQSTEEHFLVKGKLVAQARPFLGLACETKGKQGHQIRIRHPYYIFQIIWLCKCHAVADLQYINNRLGVWLGDEVSVVWLHLFIV